MVDFMRTWKERLGRLPPARRAPGLRIRLGRTDVVRRQMVALEAVDRRAARRLQAMMVRLREGTLRDRSLGSLERLSDDASVRKIRQRLQHLGVGTRCRIATRRLRGPGRWAAESTLFLVHEPSTKPDVCDRVIVTVGMVVNGRSMLRLDDARSMS